ncbi:MAG: type I restriction enzyme HsdR N-terminal domain-containing protein [Bacteroidales bacterium]|nr:type I restriction enzyme HsdR N-terminal domain-containing protein [Bacteroidales bacterium]
MMERLNLPTYSFNIKSDGTRRLIFDAFRRKWVVLTSEEWVRQHFARYLTEYKDYPESLISLEHHIKTGRMNLRCDMLVFSRSGIPVMLVECKAPDVILSQQVFDQAASYYQQVPVLLVVVTNGLTHYCAQVDQKEKRYVFQTEIPDYEWLLAQSGRIS